MQTLNEDLKNKTFRSVYLLYGEEEFLKKSYKNRLKDAISEGDTMNVHFFEGKSLDVKEVISLSDTMPFLASMRLLIIENSGFFKSPNDLMIDQLSLLPETTCMVFVESEVDKRGRMFKRTKEVGYCAEFVRQDMSQLSKWAASILAKEGKKITVSTMDLFLSKTGDDMEHIRMELEKLISYTFLREVITDEDVETVCSVLVTNKIFDMVSAVVAGHTRKAMELYEDLLTLKEPPMRILFLIAKQFNQLLQVKDLLRQGADRSRIASAVKIPPFVAGKLMSQTSSFTKEKIVFFLSLCVEMEEAIKSGQLSDRIAVELILSGEY